MYYYAAVFRLSRVFIYCCHVIFADLYATDYFAHFRYVSIFFTTAFQLAASQLPPLFSSYADAAALIITMKTMLLFRHWRRE